MQLVNFSGNVLTEAMGMGLEVVEAIRGEGDMLVYFFRIRHGLVGPKVRSYFSFSKLSPVSDRNLVHFLHNVELMMQL